MMILPTEKGIDWKRPPLVVFALVLINVLVFAFYQSDDERLLMDAVDIYQEDLLAMEASAYQAYNETLELDQRVPENDQWLMWYIIMDEDFTAYLEENYRAHIAPESRNKWRLGRQQLEEVLARLSAKALGLDPHDIGFITVLSHQFLHGGIAHLLGNMVFLLLTGFAVEAALGHARFLAYYLISGVGAGLLFSLIHVISGGASTTLIGASGAISGVMAMYVSLFKFRKIEFFYWFFIFTGYFRAAAVIILPAYILKEVYMLLMYEGTNVAYTAHIGGFIVGGALILGTQLVRHKAIDTGYLDETEAPIDPYRMELNELYRVIANCDFKKAWISLKEIQEKHPKKSELLDIKFNLLTALDREKASEYLMRLLGRNMTTTHICRAQAARWQKMSVEEKAALGIVKRAGLVNNLLSIDLPHIAEKVFAEIESSFQHEPSSKDNTQPEQNKPQEDKEQVAVLARNIALHYQENGRTDIADKYNKMAREIMLKAVSQTSSAGAI